MVCNFDSRFRKTKWSFGAFFVFLLQMPRHLRYRPSPHPSKALLLNVRSAGFHNLPPRAEERRVPGAFVQVFWNVEGTGRIRLRGAWKPFPPGAVFFYGPGEKHHLKALHEPLVYRWLTLDGPRIGAFLKLQGMARFRLCGSCPQDLFEELDFCLQDATPHGEQKASVLAYAILLRASAGPAAAPPAHEISAQAKAWIESHFTDARLNVSALSQRFRVHRSTLYRSFKASHGVSPLHYLSRLRLRRALELLQDTPLPVAEIALRCGIPDLAYFSRQIRRHTGHSPSGFRRRP
jgi:AraC-like DNA-binding protein